MKFFQESKRYNRAIHHDINDPVDFFPSFDENIEEKLSEAETTEGSENP